ncbi:MAG: hypothetical protein RL014_652 [Pseudomonadota bacterium]|jgi:hypothetical protein
MPARSALARAGVPVGVRVDVRVDVRVGAGLAGGAAAGEERERLGTGRRRWLQGVERLG